MTKKLTTTILISTLFISSITPFSICFADTFDYDEVYNSGYANGTIDGYWQGYEDGRANGYNEGFRDGYNFGLNSGYEEGYSNGHSNGYNDGYNNGYNDGAINDRYDIGYSDGLNSGINTGYTNGHNDGFSDGYNAGYQAGYQDRLDAAITQDGEDTTRGIITDVDNAITDYTEIVPDNNTIINNTVAMASPDGVNDETNIVDPTTVGVANTKKAIITSVTTPDTGAPTEENHSSEFPWWVVAVFACGGFSVIWWLTPTKKIKPSKKSTKNL